MSVQDVIKKSFLQGFQTVNLTMGYAVLLLVSAGILGIYLFMIYRIITVNTFYSKSFNVSLIMMCVITTAIIVSIQSNVIVSLGMVGALSIVRFRTAIKEPLDLIFMFWSISIGIICGAGMLGLALILTIGSTVLLLVFYHVPDMRKSMILVVHAESNSYAESIYEIVKKYDKYYSVKSRNLTKENSEFLLEIRLKNYEELLKGLNGIGGVISVSLVAHKGEAIY